MKALTVQQPWAWAIVHGGKDVENRTQAWSYRGPLAIHAGKQVDETGLRVVPSIVAAEAVLLGADLAREVMLAESQVRGAVIGVVNLVDAHVAKVGCCESWWAEEGRDIVHLVVEEPVALPEPVPCCGALGLWTVPDDVEIQVALQIAKAVGCDA